MQCMFKSIFTSGAKLVSQTKLLQDDLMSGKFAPQDVPKAVMQLDMLYQNLMQSKKWNADCAEHFQKFTQVKQQYSAAVLQFISAFLAESRPTWLFEGRRISSMQPVYPKHIRKLRKLFKDIDCQVFNLKEQSEYYLLQKFAKLAAIVAGSKQPDMPLTENMRNYYNKLWHDISAITFAAPEALQLQQA